MRAMPDPQVEQQMRADWDRRAREDASYYVAFGRRGQTAEEFFATAKDVLHAIEIEFRRFPPSAGLAQLAALEIGCGPGRLLVPLSRRFGRIAGVDVSPEMVELARRNLAGAPHARVEVTSGADLAAFADESIDFCYSYAVFQHIPSRAVVLSYLREARRVLKTGGLLKCQFNASEDPSGAADTWSGVRFRGDELREFCREHDFQLLLLDGDRTQNLWITARKKPDGWSRALRPATGARLNGVGNTYTSDLVVPVSGRFASASLWLEDLTEDADINNLEVEFAGAAGGRREKPCYIGRHTWTGPTQVNVFLPRGIPTGLIPVRLWILGEPVCKFAHLRVIPAPPRVPRLLSVRDGINLLSGTRIETHSLKIEAEELGADPAFAMEIDGIPLDGLEVFCVDPLPERYMANAKVPAAVEPGLHQLTVTAGGRRFAPVPIEIAA